MSCFSYIFCYRLPMVTDNWVIFKSDQNRYSPAYLNFDSFRFKISHSFPFPKPELWGSKIGTSSGFSLLQPLLKSTNIFFMRIELLNDREQ